MRALRHLRVACALIERDGLVLAAQRGAAMSHGLKWEFPGGKIRRGESPEACLRREIREELGIAVTVGEALPPSRHRYPDFVVTLHPFRCAVASGEIILREHAAVAWLAAADLGGLDWAAADLPVLAAYLEGRAPAP